MEEARPVLEQVYGKNPGASSEDIEGPMGRVATSDAIAMEWIEHFEKHTAPRKKGVYRLYQVFHQMRTFFVRVSAEP